MRQLLLLGLLFVVATAAAAQTARVPTPQQQADAFFKQYVASVKAGTSPDERGEFSDPAALSDLFFLALVSEAERTTVVKLFEDARVAKQLGTSATGSGTTSIAARGDSPSVLGLALEHGLITGGRTGDTITLRGNLVGLLEGATGMDYVDSYTDDRPGVRFLRKLSVSASFDPGSTTDNAIDPNADRLTSWSGRLDVKNDRDPRGQFSREWQDLDMNERRAMLAAGNDAMAQLWQEPAFIEWREETKRQVVKTPVDQLDAVLALRLEAFRQMTRSPATQAAVNRVVARTLDYLTGRRTLIENLLKTPLLVVEYSNNRPLNEPRTSDIRFVAEGPLFSGALVANAAVNLFDTIPIGAERIRHLEGSLQWDLPLKYRTEQGAVVLTLAGRVQWLQSGVVIQNALVPDTKGTIGVFQLKATVPIAEGGLQIPISITWANRSELIKEKFVRGQVGMTFDLDSLIARHLLSRPLVPMP